LDAIWSMVEWDSIRKEFADSLLYQAHQRATPARAQDREALESQGVL
jgi:hypothetical protein